MTTKDAEEDELAMFIADANRFYAHGVVPAYHRYLSRKEARQKAQQRQKELEMQAVAQKVQQASDTTEAGDE